MVVRPMPITPIAQCDRRLDFKPQQAWPEALPAYSWQGLLLSGFSRREGRALDLWKLSACSWLEAVRACYTDLGLGELARLYEGLKIARPTLAQEFREPLFAAYGLRWSERLEETLDVLLHTPLEFQRWIDDKKWGARDLAVLLAVPQMPEFLPFLEALIELPLSKSQGVQALEWVVELHLMGRPLNDLMPSDHNVAAYLSRLERWRRPQSQEREEQWRKTVTEWPWPSQVQGRWQRIGDEAGLEIKIHTTSPQDFHKKLERLQTIRDAWSCNP